MKATGQSIVLALLLLTGLSACKKDRLCERGKGDTISREVDLPALDGFNLATAANVNLYKGDSQKVVITGQDNIIDLIEYEVNNNVWDITSTECFRDITELTIDITMPDFRFVGLSGSGNIIAHDHFGGLDEIEFLHSGSGNIDFSVDATRVYATLSGAGNMYLEGYTPNFDVVLPGAVNLYAYPLTANYVTIDLSGNGDCWVTATTYLSVNLSGSGNVYYRGFPILALAISGSGYVFDDN